MKRSELNRIMSRGADFADRMGMRLPPFARWGPDDWRTRGAEYDEIRDNMLGWDITDFGGGDFPALGLLMFTLRNGNFKLRRYSKPYAEKMLIVEEGQVTPFHFHWRKMEDIIVRGGGNLMVELHNSTPAGRFSARPVAVSRDGRNYRAPAGTVVRLTPGESITLVPGLYHKFWGEPGSGRVLLGEVSKVNDDRVDNRFRDEVGRFPVIDEDEPPLYLLANEYPPAGRAADPAGEA